MKTTKLTAEQKEANKLARKESREQVKEIARIEGEKNQPEVKEITINIEWRKSRTWGNCPRATALVSFRNGTFERNEGFYASGCGYDKESQVISDIFNQYLKYKLWRLSEEQIKGGHGSGDNGPAPYGINYRKHNDGTEYRGFAGGIGVNCYYRISEHIGGKFESLASGKSFDAYKYTDL
jgi:hypothetical protein